MSPYRIKMKTASRAGQRGVGALAVSVILLFVISLVAFFANRTLIFEQKTSANQQRATQAYELAQAGLEWALARINDDWVIDAATSCASATTGFSTKLKFRDRYLAPTASSGSTAAGYYPIASSFAGCTLASATGALSCVCPTAGTAPTFANTTDARFRVQFNAVAADPLSVEIVSTGCTSDDAACGGSSTADARAVVRVLVKDVSTLGQAPGAAVLTGSATVTGGNLSVVNTDQASNGITINAGTSVTQGTGTNVQTVPGTPPSASILDNDSSLSALTNADADGDLFFQSIFGKTIDSYKKDTRTKVLTIADCSTATACGTLVSTWYNRGFQQFWVDPDVSFTNANLPAVGTLGTAGRPIYIAGAGNLDLKSNLTAYGLLYAATATASENWDYSGSGSGTLFGALVSRGSFNKGSGTLNVVYDPSVFNMGGAAPTGKLIRVPGSWRDVLGTY